MSQHIALLYIKNINQIETQRKEDKTMDIEMFGKLSDAFGQVDLRRMLSVPLQITAKNLMWKMTQ